MDVSFISTHVPFEGYKSFRLQVSNERTQGIYNNYVLDAKVDLHLCCFRNLQSCKGTSGKLVKNDNSSFIQTWNLKCYIHKEKSFAIAVHLTVFYRILISF